MRSETSRDEEESSGGSLIFPEPATDFATARIITRRDDPERAVVELLNGHPLRLGDAFGTGLPLLAQLRATLATESDPQAFRSNYRRASHRLLVPIHHGAINLRKSPAIGWLPDFYPQPEEFGLPFPAVQGLNSSWQWYSRGLPIPRLTRRLHPFHGTYFPTRFDHVELFADWLASDRTPRNRAIDVGVGCGVLAFLLDQVGFAEIHGTDLNPNAIESVRRELDRQPSRAPIHLHPADLLSGTPENSDLIVFNPPWLPGDAPSAIDQAIYYPDALFHRFFAAAAHHLAPSGQLAILFSNLLTTRTPDAPHPIRSELAATTPRFRLIEHLTREVRPASTRTKRPKSHRPAERVELWILAKNP